MTSLTTTRWFLIAWFKILFLEETETIIKPQFGDLGFHVSDSFGPIVLFLTELVKNYGIVISGGLNKRQLEVGLGFPARVWAGSQQWKHQILATRPVVSDKDPFGFAEKNPPKLESDETSKVFIKEKKKSTVHVDRHKGELREKESLSCPLMAGWITFMGHFFRVSFGQSFQLAWFTVHRASQVVLVVKNVPANAGDVRDMVSIPGKIPWRRKCNPLQYFCLENPMDRGA